MIGLRAAGRHRLTVVGCAVVVVLTTFLPGRAPTKASSIFRGGTATHVAALPHLRMPLTFERNVGQTVGVVRFLAHGPGFWSYFTPAGVMLALVHSSRSGPRPLDFAHKVHQRTGFATLTLRMVGASRLPRIAGLNPQSGRANWYLGNNPRRWRTGIPTFGAVRYENVYPGIDMVYYGQSGGLEYDWRIRPGADPARIRMRFAGAALRSGPGGSLLLPTSAGLLRQERPTVYQLAGGRRHSVPARYVAERDGTIGLAISPYDRSRPLIVDPVLRWSTYVGGIADDFAYGIAVDGGGNAYLTGSTTSPDFPTVAAFQSAFGGGSAEGPGSGDAFVAKINAAGTQLVYSTYIGGTKDDAGYGIAVDSAGTAAVTGETDSQNFPAPSGAPVKAVALSAAFVVRLDASGGLAAGTYLAGNHLDTGTGIALDSSGYAYITGETDSTNFPGINAPLQGASGGNGDAFVVKLAPDLRTIVYGTYFGGSGADGGNGIAVDASGSAYVTGGTTSTDLLLPFALRPTNAGHYDAFVIRLSPDGRSLQWGTYLGGSQDDIGTGISVDRSGGVHVAGTTSSKDFPVQGAIQSSFAGGESDGFVTELNPSGSSLAYSTYLGGSGQDEIYGLAVDAAGDAYVGGRTTSSNLSVPNAVEANYGGSQDGFVAALEPSGSGLIYGTYFGGPDPDVVSAVAVTATGAAYIAGESQYSDYATGIPIVNAIQAANAGPGDSDAFAAVLEPQPAAPPTATPSTSGSSPATPTATAAPIPSKTPARCKKNAKRKNGKCVCKKGYVKKNGKCVKKKK